MAKKILIVDDEKDLVEMLKMRLEANDYEIITAYNGEEGLEKAELCRPDLILLDIMMPGISGFEVLRRLKDNAWAKDIPVIMLTAKGDTNSIFKAEDMSVKDYIMKPYNSKVLLETIRRFVG